MRSEQRIGFGVRGLVGGGSATLGRTVGEYFGVDGDIGLPVPDPRHGGASRMLRGGRGGHGGAFPISADTEILVHEYLFVVEPQASVIVHFTRWARLDLGVGYRLTAGAGALDEDLRGPTRQHRRAVRRVSGTAKRFTSRRTPKTPTPNSRKPQLHTRRLRSAPGASRSVAHLRVGSWRFEVASGPARARSRSQAGACAVALLASASMSNPRPWRALLLLPLAVPIRAGELTPGEAAQRLLAHLDMTEAGSSAS